MGACSCWHQPCTSAKCQPTKHCFNSLANPFANPTDQVSIGLPRWRRLTNCCQTKKRLFKIKSEPTIITLNMELQGAEGTFHQSTKVWNMMNEQRLSHLWTQERELEGQMTQTLPEKVTRRLCELTSLRILHNSTSATVTLFGRFIL